MIGSRSRAVTGAACGVAAVLVGTGCSGPAPVMSSQEVALVVGDRRSTPERVVTAYIAALQEHDVDAARALEADADAGLADPWLDDAPRISDVRVRPATPEPTAGSAAEGFRTAVYVPVQFTLHGGDGSMQDGANGWGYPLARNSDADPWRIVDDGVG
ncbi:hypothetical protein ACUN7V_02745 [Quadrisphaera oryzae]|uniref:hypothetical protein n=1 Tax=Quadrisphaera TaxID=317661 RepID=UPI0016470F8B|nr:hypothetical protein [Quadrisphaera sp. RL12-1S]MBC3761013.1 hypothetical protein [Quadrisphaera sp. RL12-1S]